MAEIRTDDYASVVSMLMRSRERGGQSIAPAPLEQLYATDGLAAVIVDRPAEDALARGFEVEGDEDETILNEVDRLDAIQVLTDATRWARLHGAGVILALLDDGLTLDRPVNFDRIERVNDLLAYPVTAITPSEQRYTDPRLINYGEPVFYTIRPRAGLPFMVHESRLLRISGQPLSYAESFGLSIPWVGRSALEACRADLVRYRDALRLTREILRRKQQAVYKMVGLEQTLKVREVNPDGTVVFDGRQVIMERLNLADMVRSVENSVAVDGEDDYAVLDTNLNGIDTVLGGFRLQLAATASMTVPVLFGEGLSGLNNSGAGEQGIYHGLVRSIQERGIRPCLERLASMIWAQKEVRATEPETWRIAFRPLWSPTEAELAKTALDRANARKADAETVVALSGLQVVTPEQASAFISAVIPEMGVMDPGASALPNDDEETAV